MPDGICRILPDGSICVGRSDLVNRIKNKAFTDRATLLFGGRQAGKTTLLRRLASELNESTANVKELGDLDAAVYVNLMKLDYQAEPADFFRTLTHNLKKVCENGVEGFDLSSLPSDTTGVQAGIDLFHEDVVAISQACGEVELRALFLLDESQRVLGSRFPRGFQDNLFALLYGTEIAESERVAIVFAGGKELYGFCEDETSPIGSRAAMEIIKNLDRGDILELLNIFMPADSRLDQFAELIWSRTGGQAGMTARLVERLVVALSEAREIDITAMSEEMKTRHAELFKLWVLSLDEEAKCIHESLLSNSRLRFDQIARTLRESQYDQYIARTVCELLEFTGIARVENRELLAINEMYWEFVGEFHIGEALADDEQEVNNALVHSKRAVWHLIERLELEMRAFVLEVYKRQWPGQEFRQMRRILGESKWSGIERIKERSSKSYRLSPGRAERSEMACMYLGDLSELIVSNQAWQHFSDCFRDKRQLQDLIAAISPVRNDRAHFAEVPEKELDRCRIACDDLLVLIDQAGELASS